MQKMTELTFLLLLAFLISLPLIFCNNNCNNDDSHLSKSHLIVATYKNPLGKVPNVSITQAGLVEVECLALLTETLDFTYDVKTPIKGNNIPNGEYGFEMKNGSWAGAMGLVERKEVDMCISVSPFTAAKNKIMDTSVPVNFDDTSILMPYPKESGKISVLVEPFKREVWLCILITALLSSFVLWIVNRFYTSIAVDENHREPRGTFIEYMFLFIEMQSSRRPSHRSRLLSYRFVCGSVLLASVVLGNYYSAIYTSILAVPRFQVTIKSIEDIAADPKIKVYLFKDTPTENYIQTSPDKNIKIIRDQIKRNPSQRLSFQNYTGDISSIIKDNRVFLNPTSGNERMIQESYNKNKQCKVTIAEKTLYSRIETIAYPKGSPLVKPIDRKLLLLQQSGLLDYVKKKALKQLSGRNDKNPCLITKNKTEPKTGAMDLRSFSGAFFILGIGYTLAFIARIFEWIFNKK